MAYIERMEEPLDFTKILHRQIWTIMQAKNDNDVNKYIRSVENFEDLLISKTQGDKDYVKDIEAITDTFTKNMKGLNPNSPPHIQKINRQRELMARGAFRALIKLIERAGFLPRKEIEGVISEYDGEMIERLLALEKKGIHEIDVVVKVDVDETDVKAEEEKDKAAVQAPA